MPATNVVSVRIKAINLENIIALVPYSSRNYLVFTRYTFLKNFA